MSYLPIEDYAIIGDLHTVALVGKNGSIDWCCLPSFDAPSVFGALLDEHKGGFFRLAPTELPGMKCMQMYLPETNVLLTRFLHPDGIAEITDFMPLKQDTSDPHEHEIIRSVEMVRGSLAFELTCQPAFNYARDSHAVEMPQEGCALFHSKNLHLAFASPFPLKKHKQDGVQATFTLYEGQSAHFLLKSTKKNVHAFSHLKTDEYRDRLQQTLNYWRRWIAYSRYRGRWREYVQRSALVLKLLTYQPTGAIVAAPTTSLPEGIGEARNWDYRYTWLRDASFTLYSLLSLGLTQEAEAFMDWLDARCHELRGDGSLQPIYGIHGQHDLKETTLSHLEGYRQSKPVCIGNEASQQKQLGVYGELMDAVYIFNQYASVSYDLWEALLRLLDWLSQHWQDPDESIWEVRGGAKPFVQSRVMSWVAFDRAQRIARHRGLPAPLAHWMDISSQIYEQVMKQGWNKKRNSFVQYYGSDVVDASVLLMSVKRFTGYTEPRMIATIQHIRDELATGALVRRYNPHTAANDGIRSEEGYFGACSFWLAEALARAGYRQEGRLLLEKMLAYGNHVGLYAEEVGPTGEALGNYPQAFTHLSLITACMNIDQALDANPRDVEP
jgi:GH15 family glucan-1,4-alpha-glucosidase